MTLPTYQAICQRVWALYQRIVSKPDTLLGTRNVLFPPPPRCRPVDLLIVGLSPNQHAPVAYVHSFSELLEFARCFEYVSGNGERERHHYDPYYRSLLDFARRVDERFGVWWQVERDASELLVDFTDALHIATLPGNDDVKHVCPRSQAETSVWSECKVILEMELLLLQPKAVLANGVRASELLWELCAGQSLGNRAVDTVFPRSRFGCPVHLAGFLTRESMDRFSKARLVREIQSHSSFT